MMNPFDDALYDLKNEHTSKGEPIMKSFFSALFFLTLISAAVSQSPEKVYRITQEYYSNDWYQKQSVLWKKN